jgi:hypothetical protein
MLISIDRYRRTYIASHRNEIEAASSIQTIGSEGSYG